VRPSAAAHYYDHAHSAGGAAGKAQRPERFGLITAEICAELRSTVSGLTDARGDALRLRIQDSNLD
jgi:hypothetical protein